MGKPTYGLEVKKRVNRLLEALLDFVNGDFEDDFKIQAKWEEQDRHHPRLIMKTTLVALESLTGKDKYDGKLTKPQIREALNLLKDYLQILEDNRTKTKGAHEWHFTLTLRSKDKETNLKQFDKAWEDKRPEKSKALAENSQKTDNFDWHHLCEQQLEKPKRLTTNQLLSQREDTKHQVNDIHVPLALVERTKPEKRNPETQPHEGSRLYEPSYEEKQRFQHDEFLTKVLETGRGKTQGKRIAVIGEPGAGKTTLLQTIATWILKQNLGFPIWVSLADLRGKTLEEYLQRWLKNALELMEVTQEDKQRFLELFQSEDVWLLLDGVDELGVQNLSPLHWVSSQLAGWVKKARVVLSCRLNVWEANLNALEDFETYRLLNFSYPEQVREFIGKWFGTSPPAPLLVGEGSKNNSPPSLAGKGDGGLGHDGEQLWNELDKPERQRLQDLVKNPLRLALLCATWQGGDKKLPDTKAGLYYLYVKRFYSWKENCFPTNEEQQKELNAALGRLAKRAINQETSRFRLQHQLVREELGDSKQEGSLFWLALQLGWLNKVGLAAESQTEEEVYAFYHPTFEEYFAALTIDDWVYFLTHVPENPSNGIYRIFEPQWKEVILLWFGREDVSKEEKEEFIKALVEFNDGFQSVYWFQAFFLAAEGIGEFKDSSITDKIIQQIVLLSFGYFDIEKQSWRYCFLMEKKAKEVLITTFQSQAISVISELLQFCQYENTDVEFTIKWSTLFCEDIIKKISLTPFQASLVSIRFEIALTLLELDPCNPDATKALPNLISTTPAEFIMPWWHDLDFKTLVEELKRYFLDRQPIQELCEAVSDNRTGNSKEIPDLINKINKLKDSGTEEFYEAKSRLEKIVTGNPESIPPLLDIIKQSLQSCEKNDYYAVFKAIECLQRVGVSSPDAVSVLKQLIDSYLDYGNYRYAIRQKAIAALATVGIGSLEAFNTLLEVEAIKSLAAILQGDLFKAAVAKLEIYLQDSVYKECPDLYYSSYQTLWHCAQNLPYPAFYQAWHEGKDESRSVKDEQENSSFSSLNQPDLPQTLQTAISKDTQLNQTIHPIYIDTNQFLEPDRPAAEIYSEMVAQGCPDRSHGEPTTMQQLKVYWKLFRTVKRVVLLFYSGDTTVSHPYGEGFLTALSKLGGAICVIGEKPQENIPLQFFSLSQPVADVLQWLRGV